MNKRQSLIMYEERIQNLNEEAHQALIVVQNIQDERLKEEKRIIELQAAYTALKIQHDTIIKKTNILLHEQQELSEKITKDRKQYTLDKESCVKHIITLKQEIEILHKKTQQISTSFLSDTAKYAILTEKLRQIIGEMHDHTLEKDILLNDLVHLKKEYDDTKQVMQNQQQELSETLQHIEGSRASMFEQEKKMKKYADLIKKFSPQFTYGTNR